MTRSHVHLLGWLRPAIPGWNPLRLKPQATDDGVLTFDELLRSDFWVVEFWQKQA
jgi:hypothetical protein